MCVVFGNVVLNNEGFYVGCSSHWRSHRLFSQLNSYQKHPTHVVILGATCKHCWHGNHMPWKYCNGNKPFLRLFLNHTWQLYHHIILLISNIKKYSRTSLKLSTWQENLAFSADHLTFLFKVSDKIAKCDLKHPLSPTTILFLSCPK